MNLFENGKLKSTSEKIYNEAVACGKEDPWYRAAALSLIENGLATLKKYASAVTTESMIEAMGEAGKAKAPVIKNAAYYSLPVRTRDNVYLQVMSGMRTDTWKEVLKKIIARIA